MDKLILTIIFQLVLIICVAKIEDPKEAIMFNIKDSENICENTSIEIKDTCIEKLIIACKNNNFDAVKGLVEAGCNVNGIQEVGINLYTTPLASSLRHEDSKILEYLLINGADPNLTIGREFSPFHSSSGRPINILKLLHKYGGDINTVNKGSNFPTLIILAMSRNRTANVKYLVENGAPIYIDTLNCSHPMFLAISKCDIEMLKYFINNKSDINLKYYVGGYGDPSYLTPLDYVVYIFSRLDKSCAIKMIDYLIENGAKINNIEGKLSNPLLIAAGKKDIELVEKLINLGALMESDSYSALFSAAKLSNSTVIEFFLSKGANPNIKDSNGNTPLHISFECCGDGFGEMISMDERIKTFKLFRKYGANLEFKNNRGVCILDYIKNGRFFKIGEMLVLDSTLTWNDIIINPYNPLEYPKQVITSNNAFVRSHPSLNAPIIIKLKKGDVVVTDKYNSFGDYITFGNFKGKFDMVKYGDIVGFMFNGILQSMDTQ